MADLFSIGVSGLQAAQRQMEVTSHNISNLNTAGYSRQSAELVTRNPQFLGNIYLGNGVEVDSIRRSYSEFLNSQIRDLGSTLAAATVTAEVLGPLENLLADSSVGISPAIDSFFGAFSSANGDPTSIPARQVVLSEAQLLSNRFGDLYAYLDQSQTAINKDITATLVTVSGLASEVAALNEQIVLATATGASPNDLLDRRDSLLETLALQVDVRAVEQVDGAVNIFVGQGQALVVGSIAAELVTTSDPFDATRLGVGLRVGGAGSPVQDIGNSINGGRLGGLLDARADQIDPAYNELGRIAIALTETLNQQHRLGMDLNGQLGGDLFSLPAPQVRAAGNNIGTGLFAATISDVTALTASDYELEVLDLTAGSEQFQLIRRPEGTSQILGPGTSFTVDGVDLSLASGALVVGDSFLIRPTHFAARDLSVAVTSPESLALASPVASGTNSLNSGDGAIGAVTMTDATLFATNVQGPTALPISMQFDTPATTFTLTDANGVTQAGIAYTAGSATQVVLGGNDYGFSITLNGTPQAGDSFTFSDNAGGVGDNSNGLLMTALQTAGVLDGGSATYQSAYQNLLGRIATETGAALSSVEATGVLVESAVSQRLSVSGVNLDEEAANLLRFQQAYQASARVVSVASDVFDTLINSL